jgi:hypothetical protein
MRICRVWLSGLALAGCILWVAAPAQAQDPSLQKLSAAQIPLDKVPEPFREKVRETLTDATLFGQGPVESFAGQPPVYDWLLDHPDRAMRAWRRLGAKCSEIRDQGNNKFTWTDGQGSEVHWSTVYQSRASRIWYAEGNVRAAGLLPPIGVQAVLYLRHGTRLDNLNRTVISQQAEVFLKTDSKAAVLLTRLLGASAPRLAEQLLGQIEVFFSGITWYLEQHPERADRLLADAGPPSPKPR